MGLLARLLVGIAVLVALFVPRPRRSPERQARLERAVAALDRELAGDLELVTMFMQTKQPAVLDNAAYQANRDAIASEDGALAARLDALYDALPEAEAAMEKRGPAGSIPRPQRGTVERWEGEARTLQRELRAALRSRPRSAGDKLIEWVRARVARSPVA